MVEINISGINVSPNDDSVVLIVEGDDKGKNLTKVEAMQMLVTLLQIEPEDWPLLATRKNGGAEQ